MHDDKYLVIPFSMRILTFFVHRIHNNYLVGCPKISFTAVIQSVLQI